VSAGAASRLLIDYPEPYRSQILDYLFKPNYGANIQHLKVEIGGDVDSTDGAEPSHMHGVSDLNFTRGYEWWLMQQAKLRNPNITFGALAWGAPGWLGNGQFFSQDTINYIISFIQGAQSNYGLTISDVGIWNETNPNIYWIIDLKNALVAAGLSTQVVAADQGNLSIVSNMLSYPPLVDAIDVLGIHYPTISQPIYVPGNKPVWATEAGPWRGDWTGAQSLANDYNEYYASGRMTRTEIWSMISSFYDFLPLAGSGLMYANTPWSGYYDVQPAIWATAHTTQFAQPGWQYLDSACGQLIGGGSFVTLKSQSDYSTIIETGTAGASQTVTFHITGGLSTGTVHVWKSDVNNQFVQQSDIAPASGSFAVTVSPAAIYSLTTTTGQSKGSATPPTTAAFPFPYADDFESYSSGQGAKYFSAINGSFEIAGCGGGRQGQCLRQAVANAPIPWSEVGPAEPASFIGSTSWTDYQVTTDVFLEEPGQAKLIGRLTQEDENSGDVRAYQLYAFSTGSWELCINDSTILASGAIPFPVNTWHTMSMILYGTKIQGVIDGVTLVTLNDNTYTHGMVGVGVKGWTTVQYDNFRVDFPPGQSQIVPQSQMTATATSAMAGYPASNAVDGNSNTFWQTEFTCVGGCQPIATLPQSITISLGGNYNVSELDYLPRQDGNKNGIVTSYNVYTSMDGSTFNLAAAGNWGVDPTQKSAALGSVDAAYVRLEATAAVGGFLSVSEITVKNTQPAGGNPVPVISGLSPTAANAGDAGFSLTVSGSNFVSGSVVRWNGADRPTTFMDSTSLTASIAGSDEANAGSASVSVYNRAPAGGSSGTQTFTIHPAFNGGGGSPQTPVAFVTAFAINNPALRNDFSGWVGMKVTVGANPLYVSSLGRICVANNKGSHGVKLVDVGAGSDVSGGSVTLNMTGCTRGQFVYAALPAALTLLPGASYYLVSQEAAGGDQWYDSGAIATAQDAAAVNAVYSWNSGWQLQGGPNGSYVPPNFQYSLTTVADTTVPTPAFSPGAGVYSSTQNVSLSDATAGATIYYTTDGSTPSADSAVYSTPIPVSAATTIKAFATSPGYDDSAIATAAYTVQTPASEEFSYVTGLGSPRPSQRRDFTGWVGLSFNVGANAPLVNSVGRICVAGNSGVHTVKFVAGASGADVPGGSAQVNMSGCIPDQFVYTSLPSLLELPAGANYYLVSQEMTGGDQWYDSGHVSTTGDAATKSSVYSYQGIWYLAGGAATSYVPPNFQYFLAQAPAIAAMPTFLPAAGTFSTPQSVSLASTTPGVVIYYTLDGSAPTSSSAIYSGPIAVSATATINAIAAATGFANSSAASATFTIETQGSQTPPSNETALVTGFALSGQKLRSDFAGWVGMKLTVGASALAVTSLGRLCSSGNASVHAVELVKAGSGIAVAGGSAQVAMSGCTPGTFRFVSLSTPVTLSAGASFYLVSQEVVGGDKWYDLGSISITRDATANNSIYSSDGANWISTGGANTSFVPPSLGYLAAPPDPNAGFVTDFATSNPPLRNDFSGWVGMKLTTGSSAVNVTYLGRVCVAGNSATHGVKLVDAASGMDVPGGSVTVDMHACAAGQFVYTALAAPLSLGAGRSYYLATQEVAGGDRWYDFGPITTGAAAAVNSAVYGVGTQWYTIGSASTSYGPPNFK
jgi:hypothetical protein